MEAFWEAQCFHQIEAQLYLKEQFNLWVWTKSGIGLDSK